MSGLQGEKLSPSKRKCPERAVRQTTLDPRIRKDAYKETNVKRALASPDLVGPGRGLGPVTRTHTRPPPAPQPTAQEKGKAKASKQVAAGRSKHEHAAAKKRTAGKPVQAASSKRGRKPLSQVKRKDGRTFQAGDNVYVVIEEGIELSDGEEEEDYRCLACGSNEKEEEVLECSKCLGGWHLGCLDPPLKEVPEGDWVCKDCGDGKPAPPREATSAREKFLQQAGLGLARIEELWQENGEQHCRLRWYEVPEATDRGRQAHHAAREVFLTQQRDTVTVDTLHRHAHVLDEAGFLKGWDVVGDDVFLCEYKYDTLWKRFQRLTHFDGSDSEEEYGPSDGDESEEEDWEDTCEVIHAEKRQNPAKNMRRVINKRKKTQGREAFLEQVGALEIPGTMRRQRGPGTDPQCSSLAEARSKLMLTSVPRSLPCRAKERSQVEQFVQEVLEDTDESGCGKCLYVSGIPGTGKTATVMEVMKCFKRRAEEGRCPHFQFVEINGLRLPSPQHAYSTLYEALTGDRVGPQAAAQLLDDMMNGSAKKGGAPRRHTIVLVDEMDMLVNKTQTVLYNLFDWPGRKGSRLSIIGIANTMDLPSRLHPRIGSRLAGRSVQFQPYVAEQLVEIIASRLEGLVAFDAKAVKLVSNKVANCSGDVRRCLELCRRAAEIAEELWLRHQNQKAQLGSGGKEGPNNSRSSTGDSAQQVAGTSSQQPKEETGKVELRHVNMAVQEMFNTSHVVMIRTASRLERLLLAALHSEMRLTGRAETVLEDVADRLKLLCGQNGEPQYEFGAVLEGAVRLGSKRLILCDPGHKRLKMKMSLNVPVNDMLHVLRQDDQIRWLERVLGA